MKIIIEKKLTNPGEAIALVRKVAMEINKGQSKGKNWYMEGEYAMFKKSKKKNTPAEKTNETDPSKTGQNESNPEGESESKPEGETQSKEKKWWQK